MRGFLIGRVSVDSAFDSFIQRQQDLGDGLCIVPCGALGLTGRGLGVRGGTASGHVLAAVVAPVTVISCQEIYAEGGGYHCLLECYLPTDENLAQLKFSCVDKALRGNDEMPLNARF